MKGCGKSAPRPRRRGRHGKPHREQDQVGTAGRAGRKTGGQAGFRAAVRVGRARRPATGVPDEWPSIRVSKRGGQNPAYRPSGCLYQLPIPTTGTNYRYQRPYQRLYQLPVPTACVPISRFARRAVATPGRALPASGPPVSLKEHCTNKMLPQFGLRVHLNRPKSASRTSSLEKESGTLIAF